MTAVVQNPPNAAPTARILADVIDRYTDNLMRAAFSA